MTDPITSAYDQVLAEVDRARRARLRTREGTPADAELDELRRALESQRDAALTTGAIDRGVVGTLVRRVAEWYPEDKVALIAALGALAQRGAR